jgi:hypothetical protein
VALEHELGRPEEHEFKGIAQACASGAQGCSVALPAPPTQGASCLAMFPRPGALQLFALMDLAVSLSAAVLVPASRADASQGTALQGIAWTPCGPQLECARVRVPLDWRHPKGRKSNWR